MPRATQDTATLHVASCTRLSRSMEELSRTFHSRHFLRPRGPTTPTGPEPCRFGLIPVRSPLLGESLTCFLFLRVLRCFSSPGLPPHRAGDRPSAGRVVPFGDPRVKGHLHLTAAFRSLSRPSSPVRAKASAIRPFLLSFARTILSTCEHVNTDCRLVYFRLSL